MVRLSPSFAEYKPTVFLVIYNMADDIDAFNPFENENGTDAGSGEAVLPDVRLYIRK